MWGSTSISQLNTQSIATRSIYPSRQSAEHNDAARESREKINKMKRLIRGEEKQTQQYGVGSIVSSMQSYTESIRKSRESAKDTNTQLKKLKYNFKDISGQIRRSKTSVSAKQVAGKAKREVILLKLKKQSGQYDSEELSAAIEHAEAMERAAKKKMRHLLEEELVKVTDDAPSADNAINTEQVIEAKRDDAFDAIDKEMQELEDELTELSDEEMQAMQEEIEEAQEEAQEMTQDSMQQATEDMLDELTQALKDLVDDAFGDLADSMFAITDFEMTEDDFKKLKQKHRNSEEKDMVKADMEYLKAMFERYSRLMKDAGSGAIGSQAASSGFTGFTGFTEAAAPVEVSIPEGGIVDVSV